MQFCRFCRIVVLGVLLAPMAHAAVIVDYYLAGATSGSPPVTWAPTDAADGVEGLNLTRGPGINPAGLNNGFSANDWTEGAYQNSATAQANGDYYQFGFTVEAGHSVSVGTFDTNLRRSATNAPNRFELYASLDNFATAGTLVTSFQYRGRSNGTAPDPLTPYQWMTTDTPGQDGGNPILTQDLSGASILQNIAENTTVTFRLYAYSDLGTGATLTNTVALGRFDGPKLQGTVEVIPEPGAVALLALGLPLIARRRR